MPSLPRVTAKEMMAVIERLGFVFSRQSGSHKIYKNRENKRVTIPFHASDILHPKTLKSILRDAELSVEKLIELLKK